MSRMPCIGLAACMVSLQVTTWGQVTQLEAVTQAVASTGAFPAGTYVVSLTVDGSSAHLELSAEAVASGLCESQSDSMSEALVEALAAWPELTAFEITVAGRPLWEYLPGPADADFHPVVKQHEAPLLPIAASTNELAGKLVVLHPAHGSYWHQDHGRWFRAQRTLVGPNPESDIRNPPYHFDSSVEGWTAGNCVNGPWHTSDGWPGVLYLDQICDDAFILGPGTNFTGQSNQVAKVRVLKPTSGTHDMQLYWTSAAYPNWSEANSSTKVSCSGPQGWADVYLPLNTSRWVNQNITRLRLDLDTINAGHRWHVDHMVIEANPGGSSGGTVADAWTGDASGAASVMLSDVGGFTTSNPTVPRSTYQPSNYYYWTMGYQWGSMYEDDMTSEFIRFLERYVQSSGAEVWVSRNLYKNAGDFNYNAFGYPNCSFPLPRWQIAAKYHLQEIGMPSWIWDPPYLTPQLSKDIRSRPYYANYRMEQKFPGQNQESQSVWGNCVSLSFHSNAFGEGTARGTETFWNTARYTYLESEAIRFATSVNNGIINAIRNHYDGFWADAMYVAGSGAPPEWPGGTYHGYQHAGGSTTRWQDRGVKTTNFGEIREAKMPAAFPEIAFHDNWKWYPDNVFIMDQIFRAAVAWGLYESICNQFYVTPKPRLAATVVSTNFPSTVSPNATINGTVTMRNHGTAWCWGNRFEAATKQYLPYTVWKLKAADNDQFTPGTKISIGQNEVTYPGQNVTFAITMTAPATPGVYTTRWRMVKDDARGGGDFGSTTTAQITVVNIGPTVTSVTPGRHGSAGFVSTVVRGTDFAEGATVKLARSGQPDILGGDILRISDTQITCTFGLSGASPGNWDVVVTNPDNQSGSLAGVFFICADISGIGDFNHDCAINAGDVALFLGCVSGPEAPIISGCDAFDLDGDADVDQEDFGTLQRCMSGQDIADPACGT